MRWQGQYLEHWLVYFGLFLYTLSFGGTFFTKMTKITFLCYTEIINGTCAPLLLRLHEWIKPKLVSSVSRDRLISGGTGLK